VGGAFSRIPVLAASAFLRWRRFACHANISHHVLRHHGASGVSTTACGCAIMAGCRGASFTRILWRIRICLPRRKRSASRARRAARSCGSIIKRRSATAGAWRSRQTAAAAWRRDGATYMRLVGALCVSLPSCGHGAQADGRIRLFVNDNSGGLWFANQRAREQTLSFTAQRGNGRWRDLTRRKQQHQKT